MAFRLNKLRDFYLVVNKVLTNKTNKLDSVESVLQDRLKFKSFIDSTSSEAILKPLVDNTAILSKIVTKLV